jgi:SAM-dependent methyltransferase
MAQRRIGPHAPLLLAALLAPLFLMSCESSANPDTGPDTRPERGSDAATVTGTAPQAPAPAEGAPRLVAADESVRPGINKSFKNPELDPSKFKKRFEGESREVYFRRGRITKAARIEPGMSVADVGAGTGLFMDLFSRAVGPEGKVYAIDIAPKLVDFMKERAAKRGYDNVEPRLCSEKSIDMPANSVDVVFVCDTYHHFEYPQATLASIHKALRPGGHLVIVDFERIPGKSRPWILGHVRAGKEVFSKEITAAGFELVEEPDLGLKENYLRRFIKR